MIEYKNNSNNNGDIVNVTVFLDGKFVGVIEKVGVGWRYFPRGHEGGEIMTTCAAVKKSLEAS